MIFLGKWISGWLDMMCGLISVLTFTLYRPWWDFKFRIYWSKKMLIKRHGKLERAIESYSEKRLKSYRK